MNEGDVFLARLQQADGQLKTRPVLALRRLPPFNNLLVCGISTQLSQAVPGFDELMESGDTDFRMSGLKAPSLIRLGYLAALPQGGHIGRIGSISPERHERLVIRLAQFIKDGRAGRSTK